MIRKEWLVLSGVVLLALLLGVVPFASGCAPKLAAEKYVTALNLADLTGPTATLAVPIDKAITAYFRSLNEKGGINGIKVNYIVVDSRYDTARVVAAYKRCVTEPKLLFVLPPSTAAVKALAPMMEVDKTVGWGPPDGESQAFPGRYFLMGPAFQDGFAAMLDWVVADWKAKGKPGMPKVGYLSWDNPYGREPLRGGKEYAEKMGVTLLPPEFYPVGSLKHDVYLTRLAGAGANYIYVGGVEVTPIDVIGDAFALGLTKDIQFICDYFGPSEVPGARARPEIMEGTVIYSYYLRGEEGRKNTLSELWKSYGYGDLVDMPDTFLMGITAALTFEAGARRALEDVGYEKLDGEAMFQAMKKLTGVDINKGLTGPCTWSETERRESKLIKFYRFEGGMAVPITDWVNTPDAVSLYKW